MGLSRSSAEAVPSAAGRGRASSGNWNTDGYRLPGNRLGGELSLPRPPAVRASLGPSGLRPWKGCREFQG